MPSATLFLPRVMTVLMNLATCLSPYLGSGSPSLFLTSPLRGMIHLYFGFFAPYLDRLWRRSWTPLELSVPRILWERTPGRSLTRPPRINTTECSCKLWPTPGMYDVTSMPLVSRTRATLRSAEFGFFGVVV